MIIDIVIWFCIILYVGIGLFCSFYGTSFIFIGGLWEKQYEGIQEKFDWVMLIFFYICITAIWPGFAAVLAIIHKFDKTMFESMNEDFDVVLIHHFGEIYNIGVE